MLRKKKINTQKYESSITYYNAESTQNKTGTITNFVEIKLNIRNHSEQIHLAMIELEKANLFLEYNWLQKHNPIINWSKPMLLLARCYACCERIY